MGEPGKAKRRRGTLVPLLQIFCHDDDDQDLDGDQDHDGDPDLGGDQDLDGDNW